jgi:SNF2 family DNA or RNA helicase
MYTLPNKAYEYLPRPGVEIDLYKKLEPLLMRLRAKDHLKMPELFKNVIEVEFPAKHRARYIEMEKRYITEINDKTIAAINKGVAGMKLRQFANGFVYWSEPDEAKTIATGKPQFIRHTERLHDEKVNALVQLVDEMNGRPLLVAYEFEADYLAIMAALPDAIDLGKVPPKELKDVVAKWNRGEIPVALGHPQSIGHGLNLQEACNTICFFNPIWDLELYLQFIARVWRQGSPFASVMVHHIVCKKTRDERVAEAVKTKEVDQTEFDLAIVTPI